MAKLCAAHTNARASVVKRAWSWMVVVAVDSDGSYEDEDESEDEDDDDDVRRSPRGPVIYGCGESLDAPCPCR